MANDALPISPSVLSWARERAGYSIDEAAETFRRIASWEAGEGGPTYPQLEQLAEKFGLPVAVFFFPEPPASPAIRESFRTLPDAEFKKIPRRITKLVRKAKAMQLNIAELGDGKNPSPRLITREISLSENADVEVASTSIRNFLGISIDDQFGWQNSDIALKAWRRAVQSVGIFVFKEAFHEDDFSGISLFDEIFPIIFVNNSTAKTRQIFTVMHELAHLLFHTSGVDTTNDNGIFALDGHDRQIEILCNNLASNILVPEAAFLSVVEGLDHSERSAEAIATKFSVSREMIYRKFLDRRWIDKVQYLDAARKWSEQFQPAGSPGGDYYWTKLSYLGDEYVRLALKSFSQNKIDEQQLGEYLDTKPRNIATLTERFQKAAE